VAEGARAAKQTVEVPCPECRRRTGPAAADARDWGCPTCSREWVFRRCSNCAEASHVGAFLRSRSPWTCVWCGAENKDFRSRRDPAERTAGAVVNAADRKGLDFAWPRPAPPSPAEPAPPPVGLVVTTNDVPGYRIVAVHGDVLGVTARSTSVLGSLDTNLRTIGGGEIPELARLLHAARHQARDRMWAEAHSRGANAVIATRYDCNELQDVIVEVAAYGTAVTVVPAGDGSVDVPLLGGAPPEADGPG
jgi:uncharacterized protein YbjQ (UPF0145 family)